MVQERFQKTNTIYWGWYIVSAAFVTMGINYGSRYCYGIFVNPMAADLHWSRATIAFSSTLEILSYSVGGILSGHLLDRVAPKWIATIGSLLLSAAFFSMAFVHTPLQLYLTYGVLAGAGGSFLGVVVCNSYVGKWFHKKRGLAIGIASMGIGVAQMLLPFVLGPVMKTYGWRAGFVILGCLVLVLGLTTAQLLMVRTKPTDHGLLPDGEEAVAVQDGTEAQIVHDTVTVTKVKFLHDSRFWVMALCFGVAVLAQMLVFVHLVAFAIDSGVDKIRADVAISIIGLTSIVGRYFFGTVSDRLHDAKYAACIGFASMAGGMLVFFLTHNLFGLYGSALLFGFGYGAIATMMPYLIADRFGSSMLGTIYGMLTFFVVAGASLGPIIGGYIYDKTASYDLAWQGGFALLVVATFGLMTLKKDGKKVR